MIKILKKIRNEWLRLIAYRSYKIGTGFSSGIRVRIWGKKQIIIGKNFYIGRDSFIECDVSIGDNVMFGNSVALIGKYDHHYQQIGSPIRLSSAIRDKDYTWHGANCLTIIEDDVWIGYGSIILGGVRICEGSIVAAGSLVTKNIEPYSIYAGSPAKKMKPRFDTAEDLKKHLEIINSKYKGKI